MAEGMFEVALIGRVTQEPRAVGDKLVSVNFAVNVRRNMKGENGYEWGLKAFFVTLKFLGGRAKVAASFTKGTTLFVRGDYDIEEYKAKDGTMKQNTVLVVSDFKFLESKKATEERQHSSSGGSEEENTVPPVSARATPVDDNDIPW